jgi:DNA polymerase-3 subunit delta'
MPVSDNWNMLGHEWAVDMLRKQVARGETRHAYLICGAPGLGRRTLALRLAQAVNCTRPIAPGEPCRNCRDCREIEFMQHPDLMIIQAEFEGGSLKVDAIRELRRTLILKPYQSKYRVALLLRFQEANDNAANALLKTLEEAPAQVILILTADDPEALLPTIVSRCEILRLRPLPTASIEAELQTRGINNDRARLIAHLSGGRPGYARRLAENSRLLENREVLLNDLQMLLPASRVDKFTYAEKLAKDKDGMRQTILIWLSYWRDVLLRTAGAEASISNVDRNMEIEFLADKLNFARARRIVHDLEQALGRLERNINARLLVEVLLLDWPD